MKLKLIYLHLFFLPFYILSLTGCSYTYFSLQNKTDDLYMDNIEGRIITESNLNSIDQKSRRNAFLLDTASKVSLRVLGNTMHDADITVELKEGDGMRFYTRSAVYNHKNFQNITFDFTQFGSILKENGVLIKDFPEIKAVKDNKTRIIFRNDGTHLKIYVDCNELIDYKTNLFSTEYLIIETFQNSRADFSGVHFVELY